MSHFNVKRSFYKSNMRSLLLIIAIVTMCTSTVTSSGPIEAIAYHREYEGPSPLRQVQVIINVANDFGLKFLSHYARNASGNFACSTLGLYLILSMASFGARGSTENAIFKTLGFSEYQEFTPSAYRAILDHFEGFEGAELRLANKMYVDNRFAIKKEFLVFGNDASDLEVDRVHFSNDPVAASARIITWVKNQTNHVIKDLTADSLRDTQLLLANTINFKSQWTDKLFQDIVIYDFYVTSNTIRKTEYLIRTGELVSGKIPGLRAEYINMPYSSDKDILSMFIILPNEGVDVFDILHNPFYNLNVQKILNSPLSNITCVAIPKFKIESTTSPENVLKQMGLGEIFSDKANFTGLSESEPPIKVSKILQTVSIEINKEGTEPVTENSISVPPGTSSNGPHCKGFHANRPFIAIIADMSYTEEPITLLTTVYTGSELV